ncbi:MAG: NUDIX domain-containing protein [Firmicutes bacterium]|nr:NUDIX domain-containing protein [Bacillota bacterium]
MKVDFFDIGSIEDGRITFVVMVSRYEGKWIFVRHKDRVTLEVPGGHREPSETLEQAAQRELFEETGAEEFELFPVCIYSVSSKGEISFGKLYFAEVKTIGQLPKTEIKEICFKRDFPKDNLTYPLIQPFLYKKVEEYLELTKC